MTKPKELTKTGFYLKRTPILDEIEKIHEIMYRIFLGKGRSLIRLRKIDSGGGRSVTINGCALYLNL